MSCIQSSQRESKLKDQLKSIKHDLVTLVTTLGGRGYSAESTPTNLLQLLKGLISRQQEKIMSQDHDVGCHGDCFVFICLLVTAVESSQ